MALFGVCIAKSQTLKADYQFQGNLNSSVAGAPSDGDVGKFASELAINIAGSFNQTLGLLRNQKFQNLLLNYEKAEKIILVSYKEHDEISSARVERFGMFEKPEEYLEAFSKFVKRANSCSRLNALPWPAAGRMPCASFCIKMERTLTWWWRKNLEWRMPLAVPWWLAVHAS